MKPFSKRMILILLALFFNGHTALADPTSFQVAFSEGKSLGATKTNDASQKIQNFNTNNLPNYTDHPSETSYYNADLTNPISNLTNDANAALPQSDSGQSIVQSFNTRPQFNVNPKDPVIQNSKLIVNDSADIANGISDQYVDCTKTGNTCHTTYTNHVCTIPADMGTRSCTESLSVSADRQPAETKTINIAMGGYVKRHGGEFQQSFNISVNLVTGTISTSNGRVNGSLSSLLPNLSCDALMVHVDSVNSPTFWTSVTINQAPSCQNNWVLGMTVTTTFMLRDETSYQVSASVDYTALMPPRIQTQWVSECPDMDQRVALGLCKISIPWQCISGKATHIINGFPVTEDCWEQAATYQCGDPSKNTCQPYLDQGCSQLNSTCDHTVNGVCLDYQDTFQCAEQKCSGPTGIQCGGNLFCLKGDCKSPPSNPSNLQDFDQAVSALSAVDGAEASLQQGDINHIFSGHPQTCSDDALGFNNCCADSGWGPDIDLSHCSSGEKALIEERKKKLAFQVGHGNYCSHKVLGICTAHKKAFCVFQSVLGQIVQKQGREGQLGIGFGSPQAPDCRGITADELSRIDFSKLDFSDFYDQLNSEEKEPDVNSENERIKQDIQNFYNNGQANAHRTS